MALISVDYQYYQQMAHCLLEKTSRIAIVSTARKLQADVMTCPECSVQF